MTEITYGSLGELAHVLPGLLTRAEDAGLLIPGSISLQYEIFFILDAPDDVAEWAAFLNDAPTEARPHRGTIQHSFEGEYHGVRVRGCAIVSADHESVSA